MYNSVNSKYTYKNSNTLKNKLNIKDEELLNEYQNRIVALKLVAISDVDFGDKFDEVRLKKIHEFLFDEVFDFAGKYREENITKENFRFAEYQYIDLNVKKILNDIDVHRMNELECDEFIERISYILTELNVLHPFREGNGRTIREFVRQLSFECGYIINLFKVPYDKVLKVAKLAVIDESEQIKLLKDIVNRRK